MNLGWFCMSWRQPALTRMQTATRPRSAMRNCAVTLMRHLRDLLGMKILKKLFRLRQAELGVLRFHAQEKAVTAGAVKARRVEDRMIGLRQSGQCQHSEYRRQRSAEHPALKRHGNKRGPGVKRLATDIQWIVHRGDPVFQRISAH